MVESLHNDGGAVQANNEFIDALAWVAHVMPSWPWSTDLYKNSMQGFKGDSVTEQDEDYAKLLSATPRTDPRSWSTGSACPSTTPSTSASG